jgi:hypothetical protein
MLRAFGAFLLVFSLLSLVVNLKGVGSAFAIGALFSFAIDFMLAHADKSPARSRVSGLPIR